MQILERNMKESARDYAVRCLRENIISLDLLPGSLVSENEVSSELGLSRTPVREALMELSRVGIVDIVPQKGSRVALINYDLVTEARFMRLVLEQAVIDQLCQQGLSEKESTLLKETLDLQEFHLEKSLDNRFFLLDQQFHFMLFQFAKRETTYQLCKNFNVHFDRVRNVSMSTCVHDSQIVADHKAIFQAVIDRDSATAQARVATHLTRCDVGEAYIQEKFAQYILTK